MTEKPRYQAIPRVLLLLRREGRWLLLQRAADRPLWPGLYDGIGGHVEVGEGILQAARRELCEEAGLEATDLRLCGVIHADEAGRGALILVLTGSAGPGELRASAEGRPVWVTTEEAMSLDLVADLRLILPRLLAAHPEDPPFLACSTLDEAGSPVIVFES